MKFFTDNREVATVKADQVVARYVTTPTLKSKDERRKNPTIILDLPIPQRS